jgi:hypothetical protein
MYVQHSFMNVHECNAKSAILLRIIYYYLVIVDTLSLSSLSCAVIINRSGPTEA